MSGADGLLRTGRGPVPGVPVAPPVSTFQRSVHTGGVTVTPLPPREGKVEESTHMKKFFGKFRNTATATATAPVAAPTPTRVEVLLKALAKDLYADTDYVRVARLAATEDMVGVLEATVDFKQIVDLGYRLGLRVNIPAAAAARRQAYPYDHGVRDVRDMILNRTPSREQFCLHMSDSLRQRLSVHELLLDASLTGPAELVEAAQPAFEKWCAAMLAAVRSETLDADEATAAAEAAAQAAARDAETAARIAATAAQIAARA